MYQKENCEIEECVKVAIQGYISTFPGEHIFYMLNKVDSQRVILLLTSNPDLYKLRQDKILMKQVETYLDNQKKLKKLEVERLYAS